MGGCPVVPLVPLVLGICFGWCATLVAGCTTIAAGKRATADGSTMCAHSNDGDGDTAGNLMTVPPATWSPNTRRNVSGGDIPQVPSTVGYFTKPGGYASTNEYQVGLAESTCNSRLKGNRSAGAILNIVDLSELGLERAKDARTAVQTMGTLAELHGYYDEGESLLVIDPGEVWIFQVLPDDSQRSAVWCAQRVPDDHVAVVANSFTIREVDLTNQQDFLCSSNVEAVAARTGRWAPGRPLDFAAVFSGPEHGKKYSTGRRMWRIYNLLGDPAAAAALPETYTEFVSAAPYPPSLATVPASLRVTNLTSAMRDQYEGTRFDMTTGMAAGPAGTPDRWLPGAGEAEVLGAWERAISLSRTIVSYVVQSRGWLPREVGGTLWFSVHAAHTSLYIPFPVGHTLPGTPSLPPGLTNNSLGAVGRGVSFYQASRFVHNAAQHRFSHAIQVVKATQRGLERSASALQAEQVAQYVNGSATIAEVAAQFNQNAVDMVAAWWSLADQLVVTVGCDSGHDGYPAWWLRAPGVGYTDGPPPAPPVPTVRVL